MNKNNKTQVNELTNKDEHQNILFKMMQNYSYKLMVVIKFLCRILLAYFVLDAFRYLIVNAVFIKGNPLEVIPVLLYVVVLIYVAK